LRPAEVDAFGVKRKHLQPPKSKDWNPATFYIVIFLLIGSMSIQMIALKKEFATFMRQSDVRIGLLREVIEKIQKGEKVDVERVLGTGDAEQEQHWDEGWLLSTKVLLLFVCEPNADRYICICSAQGART
jgi:hypothetical protein